MIEQVIDPELQNKVEFAIIETMKEFTTVVSVGHSTTTMIPTDQMARTAILVVLDYLKAHIDD